MTLTDLIAALERAEGPSRELDERLAQYGGLTRNGDGCWSPTSGGITLDVAMDLPRYTASIDAAGEIQQFGVSGTGATRGGTGPNAAHCDSASHVLPGIFA